MNDYGKYHVNYKRMDLKKVTTHHPHFDSHSSLLSFLSPLITFHPSYHNLTLSISSSFDLFISPTPIHSLPLSVSGSVEVERGKMEQSKVVVLSISLIIIAIIIITIISYFFLYASKRSVAMMTWLLWECDC